MVQAGKTGQTPKPDFKFEEATRGMNPKTVRGIAAADLMMVNYVDGEGKEQNRLAAVIPGKKGGHQVFVFNEKIQGSWVATAAYPWLAEGVTKLLVQDGDGGGVESV